VARFIQRCIAHSLSFKATAGLHHAWRAEYRLTYAPDAPRAAMFGFLNVLLATAAAHAGLPAADTLGFLEERDPHAVRFDSDGAYWRNQALPNAVLRQARDSMTSFGSCSFREPVAELRETHLL
jgi:hypothetical protein